MTAEQEWESYVAKFAPPMQDFIRTARARMQARFPDAYELVYDNYNFLVIAYGPTEKAGDAIFSLGSYAKGINLFFGQRGPELPDPTNRLRGSGKSVRHIPLGSADEIDSLDVQALIDAALLLASTPMEAAEDGRLIIKSVSAKQRPRR